MRRVVVEGGKTAHGEAPRGRRTPRSKKRGIGVGKLLVAVSN